MTGRVKEKVKFKIFNHTTDLMSACAALHGKCERCPVFGRCQQMFDAYAEGCSRASLRTLLKIVGKEIMSMFSKNGGKG